MTSRIWEVHIYDPEKEEWSVQPINGEDDAVQQYADEIKAEHPTWGVKLCKPEAKR